MNDEPGSIPIVIPEGQRTTTKTEVVERAINQTVLELPRVWWRVWTKATLRSDLTQ